MTLTITKLKFLLLANVRHDGSPVPAYIVAAACGIFPSRMSNYSRGERAISQDHLHALCDYFDCEPDDLIGTIDIEIPDEAAEAG